MATDSNNNQKQQQQIKLFSQPKKCTKKVEKNGKTTLETLNLDCLLMILDRLDASSLMDLCDVNEQFRCKVLSYKHIFANKMFEMPEFLDIEPIFEEFGWLICKVDVNHYNFPREKYSQKFNGLLKTFTTYLLPGNLTDLTLRIGIIKVDKDLLNSALPYFRNLKRFSIWSSGSDDYSRAQEHVLNEVIGNAHQLNTLEIRYIRTAGAWFAFEHLKNLEHLTFLFVELIKFMDFRQFIQKRPALKTFIMSTESVHHQHICRLITRYIPNLEQFEIRNTYMELPHGDDFDFSASGQVLEKDHEDDDVVGFEYDEEEDNDEEEDDVEDGNTTNEDSDNEIDFESAESDSDIDDVRDPSFNANNDHITSWKGIYSGLDVMYHIKRIWLKSHYMNCSDLYDTLIMLAQKNIVEYLTIQVSTLEHDFIQRDAFQTEQFPKSFTSLKTIRIISPSNDTHIFLRHFVRSLPNLTKCIVDAEKIDRSVQDTIVTLVEASNSLEMLGLKMPAVNFDRLLYMKLLGIKFCQSRQSNATKPLNIYMSSKPQLNRSIAGLKDYYDEKIIAIKFKSFMSWETDPL